MAVKLKMEAFASISPDSDFHFIYFDQRTNFGELVFWGSARKQSDVFRLTATSEREIIAEKVRSEWYCCSVANKLGHPIAA